jgi:ribonuclease P protein subunit RPR2
MADELVLERIRRLFELAEKGFAKHPERSHRYAEMIKKLSMRHNVRIPMEIRRRICKKCSRFLVPGVNCQVRTSERQRALIVKCLECGHLARYPYRKESKFKTEKTNISR